MEMDFEEIGKMFKITKTNKNSVIREKRSI